MTTDFLKTRMCYSKGIPQTLAGTKFLTNTSSFHSALQIPEKERAQDTVNL